MLKNALKLQPKLAFTSGKARRIFEIYDSANIQKQFQRKGSQNKNEKHKTIVELGQRLINHQPKHSDESESQQF